MPLAFLFLHFQLVEADAHAVLPFSRLDPRNFYPTASLFGLFHFGTTFPTPATATHALDPA